MTLSELARAINLLMGDPRLHDARVARVEGVYSVHDADTGETLVTLVDNKCEPL